MSNGNSRSETSRYNRRSFLAATGTAAVGAGVSTAGCIDALTSEDIEGILIPGLYDLSGGTADVGEPTAIGSRDAMKWINENGDLENNLDHRWIDYEYEESEAQEHYDEYIGDDPPAIIGWGTADTELLAGDAAADEVVYISASYSDELLDPDTDYNFFTNLDYTSKARAHIDWIADNDPDATIAFIRNGTAFGTTPVAGGEAYAEEQGLDVAEEGGIELALDASDADTEVSSAEDAGVDYLIHQNTGAPMEVLMSSVDSRGSDIDVMGLTWTVDEYRAAQNDDIFEGVRYVNSNISFTEAKEDEPDGWEIIEDSFEREDRDMDDLEVANINYVRGVTHTLLLAEAISLAEEDGDLDPYDGSDVREAMLMLDDFDAWGLLVDTVDFRDDDRRPTMTGRMYVVEDGELNPEEDIELPRDEGWIPPFDF